MSDKFIDVEKLIKQKKPGLLKWLPGFIIRFFKRILHQDEVNRIIRDHSNLYDAAFCDAVISEFKITLKVHGLENVPPSGGIILASNHPFGGMDAMAMVSALSPVRKDMKFIVNDVLLNLKNLKNLFAGVNKFGGNAQSALLQINTLFSQDNALCVFPAGMVSRKINGVIQDLEWKKTFVSQSIKNQKPIVPVFIDGALSPFFYRLSAFRKFLGIKANIEMLFLSDEMFKQKNKTVHLYFGKPIMPYLEANKKSHKALAEEIKHKTYALKNTNIWKENPS